MHSVNPYASNIFLDGNWEETPLLKVHVKCCLSPFQKLLFC